jgi:hypothetical protein
VFEIRHGFRSPSTSAVPLPELTFDPSRALKNVDAEREGENAAVRSAISGTSRRSPLPLSLSPLHTSAVNDDARFVFVPPNNKRGTPPFLVALLFGFRATHEM